MLLQGVRSEELPILQGIEFYFVDVAPAPVLTRLADFMTGWPLAWKCFVACLFLEESQQPT